ncbi:hypothetical protein B2J93_127 [Marssonina coronariae]|uniref:Uncharacterized protein n=1 Tax=Diplocarpon coronariae TaxID=2795749 RepID=A0A218Z539_9HELO|nr:hypothetical protein B2J93_127 [Marssonina coronariae]
MRAHGELMENSQKCRLSEYRPRAVLDAPHDLLPTHAPEHRPVPKVLQDPDEPPPCLCRGARDRWENWGPRYFAALERVREPPPPKSRAGHRPGWAEGAERAGQLARPASRDGGVREAVSIRSIQPESAMSIVASDDLGLAGSTRRHQADALRFEPHVRECERTVSPSHFSAARAKRSVGLISARQTAQTP